MSEYNFHPNTIWDDLREIWRGIKGSVKCRYCLLIAVLVYLASLAYYEPMCQKYHAHAVILDKVWCWVDVDVPDGFPNVRQLSPLSELESVEPLPPSKEDL